MIGFVTLDGGTTGGGNGATVTVNNATAFETALNSSSQLVVQVSGTINIGTLDTKPNKTIIGVGLNATISGNLKLTHTSNIIVRNITFDTSGDDLITIQQSSHIWVDHCTFIDAGERILDITHASEWVTVSWCKFYYVQLGSNQPHRPRRRQRGRGGAPARDGITTGGELCINECRAHTSARYTGSIIPERAIGGVVVTTIVLAPHRLAIIIENNFTNVRTPGTLHCTAVDLTESLQCNSVGFLGVLRCVVGRDDHQRRSHH
jgi:hypothetical protein